MVEPDKRRKLESLVSANGKPLLEKPKSKSSSKIFSPFRVIGNVSNETPFALGTLGSTFYVVTSVGRSFQIYDVATLHLLFVSQTQTPSKITALAAHYHYVFAGFANRIGVYKRGRLEHTLTCPSKALVNHIVTFGEFLIAGTTEGEIFTFKKADTKYPKELHSSLYSINLQLHGEIVGIVHPPTYLNKIVVATNQHLFIFNVNTGKLLYQSPENQFPELISAVETAPALDIIAVGTVKGGVYLYDIKKAKIIGARIMAASEDSGAKVVSLSFRTDGSPHLAAGLSNGDLFFYELEKRSRIHILRNAHREAYGGVANCKFLNGQSIVVTNGGDNCLKEYVFDPSLSTTNTAIISPPRHLRSRGGHSAPPIKIEFPQEDKSHFILSGSTDRSFWSFSLRKDAQSQEMSQRPPKLSDKRQGGQVMSMREKFPEMIAMASNQTHAGDWEDIVSAHKDETFARTWSSQNRRVGRHQFKTVDGGLVSTVCVSHCGNFALVGSANGGIGSYNLQSGLLRKKYMLHQHTVTGICIDGMNQKMVSAGLDGLVGFYNFAKLTFLGKLDLESPITSMIYHKSSDLIACALDDLSIVVIDVVTQKIVRILYGHSNRITGLDFSPDGRWIVSVALDGTLRTWDLPSGGCIDGIILPTVATSVKFSPIGDVLATTHVSGNGIFLWTNKAQFRPISTRHIEEEEFATMLLPNTAGDGGSTMIEGALDPERDGDNDDIKDGGLDQLDSSLVTLSLGPRSKYNTLLHLDVIKQRSRPKQAPKKSEKAPFFLSLSGEIVGDRAIEAETGEKSRQSDPNINNGGEESESRLLQYKGDGEGNFESNFTKLLREGSEVNDYTQFLNYLVALSPATTDLEIRSINSFPPLTEMVHFVTALTEGIKSNKNYELHQALFSLFLRSHADVIYNNEAETNLHEALAKYTEVNGLKKNEIDDLAKYCSGVIDALTTL